MANEYTLKIDGVEVTDYDNVVVNGVSYKLKKTEKYYFTISMVDSWTFVLPEENISFRNLLKNYGVSGVNLDTIYYDTTNSVYISALNSVIDGTTSSGLLFYQDSSGGGKSFTDANMNTIISNNSFFNVVIGGGSN